MTTSIIYFDESDRDMDGYGWNIVVNGHSIAERYSTLTDAISDHASWGGDYIVLGENTTFRQAIESLTAAAIEMGQTV